MKRQTALLLAAALLSGCSSTEPKPAPSDEPPPPSEEAVALETAKPGMVMLRLKKAPLRGEVLKKFEEQAGVKITWTGSERFVTLRMIQPMEWREALELVCQFTKTHATTDYQGRLILKNGYGGSLSSDGVLLEEEQRRRERAGATASSSQGGGSSSSGVQQKATYPSSGGSKTYRATTTNSRGPRNSGAGVKYNKGRDPTKIFDSVGGVTHH